MMLRTDADHLPAAIREELLHITTILFEAFAETTKGRLSPQYRAGHILTLILHGPHAEKDWEQVAPGEAFRLLAIVNYPRLARSERDWRMVRDRLRRAWEFGEITRPVLEYVKRVSKESPRTVVTVFIPEYVVGHWWEQVLHNQSALRLKGRLLFEPNVMVTSVPWQLSSSERLKTLQPQSAPGDARRGFLE